MRASFRAFQDRFRLRLIALPTRLTVSESFAVKDEFVPTLLHISDLHRTSNPRLSNADLLAAIVSDATRWDLEGIPRPELIVVSGDLIQGVELDTVNPDTLVEAQYCEAGEFLERLGEEFVDSDRSRIVIVPGNHDVHWSRSLDAMEPVGICPDGIATKALEATSGLRWNWRDQQAYKVSDQHSYASRFEHFRRFQRNFYKGIEPNPLAHGDGDLFFLEYSDLDLLVAGFSSWHGNDCFCHVGEIEPASLALSQKLVAERRMGVAVAVWHHSIAGGPRTHDYMDQRIVHRLIDFGFSVGLHGHQHYPGAAPFELRLPNLTSMVVVGAGSLAVGDNELPMGERRQFNVVVIDPDSESITVHVRGMSPAGVFTGTHRDDFGGSTFIKLNLNLPPPRVKAGIPTTNQRLDEAMTAIGNKRYEQALALIADLPSCRSMEKRRIEIEALRGLGENRKLIELFDPPRNVGEVVEVVSLLLDARQFDEAITRLHASKSLVPPSIFEELKTTIAARKMTE